MINLHNQKVCVELEGDARNTSAAIDTELSPHVIFVPVDDTILTGSENVRFMFRVMVLPVPKGSNDMLFALKAEFNDAYLGYGLEDRRLRLERYKGPPRCNFVFVAKQKSMRHVEDGTPIRIMAEDGGRIFDPDWRAGDVPLRIRLLKSSRLLDEIERAFKEQILTLGVSLDEPPGQQVYESGIPQVVSGAARHPHVNIKFELEMVRTMRASGDLDEAIHFLGKPLLIGNPSLFMKPEPLQQLMYESETYRKSSPSATVIQAAKLLAVMSQCTYLRDQDFEEDMKRKSYAWSDVIRLMWSDKVNKEVVDVMEHINLRSDMARRGIAAVAREMGLKYQPLCNFSETGNDACNGPYCGAFYDDGPSPFIVIAFKGSGTITDFLTDVRCRMIEADELSPLKGRLHAGFFNGMFSDYPCRLSEDRTRLETEVPFRIITTQLERLISAILAKHGTRDSKIQLWTTGHSLGGAYASVLWSGLLADPYPLARASIRDLFTFGSPRVGNKAFSQFVNGIKGHRVAWRFVNEGDIVPRVPVRPFLRFWSSEPYVHIDSPVELSPHRLRIGVSEIENPPPTYRSMMTATKAAAVKNMSKMLKKVPGDAAPEEILDLPDIENHSLQDGYWVSLSKH